MKKLISTILSVFLLITAIGVVNASSLLSAYAEDEEAQQELTETEADEPEESGDKVIEKAPTRLETIDYLYEDFLYVSSTENLALYVNAKTINIAVLDMRTGTIWSSAVQESELEDVSDPTLTARRKARFAPIYDFACLQSEASSIVITPRAALDVDGSYTTNIDYQSVENGVKISIYYEFYALTIVVNVALDPVDESLVFSVDTQEIQESASSGYVLVALQPLPMFGAANDQREGYIFYPDGCGAIAEFSSLHSSTESKREFFVYSDQQVNLDTLYNNEDNNIMTTLYPVFGMYRDNEGFLAIITQGAEQCSIIYAPSGESYNIARIYCTYYVRDIASTGNGSTSGETYAASFSPTILKQVFETKYYFSQGEDATYSGMARKYREYLLENDLLNDAIEDGATMPLALDFFMNTYEDRVLLDKVIVMTTFEQATEITKMLADGGVEDMLINIVAWQKKGIDYEKVVPVYRRIGGKGGLNDFLDYTNEQGYDVFMQVNMVEASSSTKRFSVYRQSARDYRNISITSSTTGNYLIAPAEVRARYESIYQPYFEDMGISGFNFSKLAYYVYQNYEDAVKLNRQLTVQNWMDTMRTSKEDFGKAAGYYGNAYSLSILDWVYDLPSTDTGYFVTTRDVPFAQILLHGYIPYSSMQGNIFYDDDIQTLKWIEYGYIPYYRLTHESSSEFTYSEVDGMFSTSYVDWIDRIIEKYQMMSDEFGYLYSQTIVSHDQVEDNVFVTVYEDGTEVYVNYNRNNSNVENDNSGDRTLENGVHIEALSYTLVKGE